MNRRELLKGIVSLPVVTTLGCSTFSSKPTTSPVAFTTMNLVFEGPFIFFMDNPQVRVFAPKVDGHRYLINNANATTAPALFVRSDLKTRQSDSISGPSGTPSLTQKTLKTKPKTSQGNSLHRRLMKQATVSTHFDVTCPADIQDEQPEARG